MTPPASPPSPWPDAPRVSLGFLPTPVVELRRLAAALGGPRIFMKRDDLIGLALGGNKIRKLEFLLGEALAQGCDTVVTGGATQSNHCRQTAAAAAVTGLECHLALGGEPPPLPEGNLLLDHLFGAVIHWCGDGRKGERIPEIARGLAAAGRRPYVIPYGGSNEVGALGFVAAACELRDQISALGDAMSHLVIASSSGGTHAGLAAGVDLCGLTLRIVGIGIDKGEAGDLPYEEALAQMANRVVERVNRGGAALARPGRQAPYGPADFQVRHEYYGGGYGVVGDLEREAIRLVARHEGILLDPVYTGRAMGGLIDLVRRGAFRPSDTVLFWHTGGIPALFGYARDLVSS